MMTGEEPMISIAAAEKPAGYPAEILGYVEPWIASPGDTVAVKVSSTEPEYTYRLVRVVQGVDLEHAPPTNFEEVPDVRGTSAGRFQIAHPGSYAVVEDWVPAGRIEAGIHVQLYFQAHLPKAGHPQALVSTLDTDSGSGFAIVISEQGTIEIWVGTESGAVDVVPAPFECPLKRWVSLDVKIEGRELSVSLEALPYFAEPSIGGVSITTQLSSPANLGSDRKSTLLFAASLAATPTSRAARPSHFFNGRLDSPVFRTTGPTAELLAQYDFARNIPEDRILDISGQERHGHLVQAPTRGVTGYDWDGSEPDWTKAKYGYGAIHFHEDDLDDAEWETDFAVTLPRDLRSGVYAFDCRATNNEEASDMVTFFVRPTAETTARSGAKVAFVLSTFTYLAYANERLADPARASYIDIGPGFDPSTALFTSDFFRMKRRMDLGLSCYDVHNDGSGVVFSSARRPIANVRPGYIMWAMARPRELSADTLFINFLERSGIAYDVLTDHDLHAGGLGILAPYHTLISGSHPEYPTLESLNAWESFARGGGGGGGGGNLVYLGGNGFYWAAALHDATGRLEVRRADQGVRTYTLPGGERVSSLTGRCGGTWRSRGRSPHGLFGVACCGEGAGPGVPYARTAASRGAAFAWAFAGIGAGELLGAEGLAGGASGDEIDSFDDAAGGGSSPRGAVVLATSTGHPDAFGIMPECVAFPIGGVLGTQTREIRSDIVYYDTHAGGAVFSVGSINWFNSLAWDDYRNNIARLTGNVLREFIRRKEGGGGEGEERADSRSRI